MCIRDSGYAPNMQWMYGNQFLNFLNETEAPDKWEQFEAFNAKAKQLPDFGFIFDETPVQTEVAATLNIVKEYNNVLKVGAVLFNSIWVAIWEELYLRLLLMNLACQLFFFIIFPFNP